MQSLEELQAAGQGGLRIFAYTQAVIQRANELAIEQLLDLPAKQYATSGMAVYDCEQLAITGISLQSGLPGTGPPAITTGMVCDGPWSLSFEIALVRCAPAMSAKGVISIAGYDEGFKITSRDAEFLIQLVDDVAGLGFDNVLATISLGPIEGGFIATTARVTAGLP